MVLNNTVKMILVVVVVFGFNSQDAYSDILYGIDSMATLVGLDLDTGILSDIATLINGGAKLYHLAGG